MSGRKYAEYRLQRERARKLALLQSIQSLRGEHEALRARLRARLDQASSGARATFAAEVQRAERWLAEPAPAGTDSLGMDTDRAELEAAQVDLEHSVGRGRQVQADLTLALVQKAGALGKQLAHRLAEVEQHFTGGRALLALWQPAAQVQSLQDALEQAHALLASERYLDLEPLLERTGGELAQVLPRVEQQEDRQQKRLYLLRALRHVCAEMGFEELAPPRYEREGDRGSAILLTVDTLDRGQIAFTLTLDRISTFSEIADGQCFEEFGQMSEYLAEQFGVDAPFYLEDGTPVPRLLHKGEMDLPGDAVRHAER